MDAQILKEAEQGLKVAKISLMMQKHTVCYTTVLFSLKQTFTEDVPTAGTDGRTLVINPHFFVGLTPNERLTLLAHEVLHVLLDHMHRRGDREHKLFNIACISLDSYILMANNTYKRLSDIRPGDFVQSPLGPNKVLGIACNGKKELGLLNGRLQCTSDHKVLSNDKFIKAEESTSRQLYVYREASNETSCTKQLFQNDPNTISRINRYTICDNSTIPQTKRIESGSLCDKTSQSDTIKQSFWKRLSLLCRFNGWRRYIHSKYLNHTEWASLFTNIDDSDKHIIFSSQISRNPWVLWDTQSQQYGKFLLVSTAKWIWPSYILRKIGAIFNSKKTRMQSANTAMQRAITASQKRPADSAYGEACRRNPLFEHEEGFFQQREGNIQFVFDLITDKGCYIAEGIVVHNCDYVINRSLNNAQYTPLTKWLYDSKYDGMTTEQVYDILNKKSDQQKQDLINQCAANGFNGGDVTYPDQVDPKDAVGQDEVTNIVLRAVTQAKAMGQPPGTMPGEIEIELQKTLNPPLPWWIILQNYLTSFAQDDFSFRRPNKKFLPAYYLPTAHSEAVCNIAIAVDISSSVTDHEFNVFIQKIDEIKKTMKPQKITVISFNTKITGVQELLPEDNPLTKLKFKGRGGTHVGEILQWAAENKPTVMLVFSDGEFDHIEPKDKRVPIVWLIHNSPNWKSQWGRTIHYNVI